MPSLPVTERESFIYLPAGGDHGYNRADMLFKVVFHFHINMFLLREGRFLRGRGVDLFKLMFFNSSGFIENIGP